MVVQLEVQGVEADRPGVSFGRKRCLNAEVSQMIAKNPKGNIDSLRAPVKQTEASIRYNHGGNKTAKK